MSNGVGCDPPGTTVKLVDESGEEIKPYKENKTRIDLNGNWEWRVAEARHRESLAASILPVMVGTNASGVITNAEFRELATRGALQWADLLIKVARGE